MPRILRITNRLNLGGPTYNVGLLSKHLAPTYETLVVAGMKDESEASSEFILDNLGITPRYVSKMFRAVNPFNDIPAYREIKKIIKEYKPDIVHTHAAKAGALGRLAAKECGVPVFLHTFHGHVFHSYFNPIKTRLFLEIERALAKVSSKIIAISEKQKHELANIYKVCPSDKIEVVPLGFDLSRFTDDRTNKRIEFRQQYQIKDDEVAIAIVGRLVPVKNHGLFLESIKEVVKNTDKKVRAFIVGDGEEKEQILQKAKELNLDFATHENCQNNSATLTFTSWITEVENVYAGVDIVALSSLNEGTPVSLIEAQASNRPIVTTEVGGVADVVQRDKTALLSNSGDVDAFAANLLRLVNDPNLRETMGKNSARHVTYKYSYQRLANDMNSLYRRLLYQAAPHYREILSPQMVLDHRVGAGRAPLGYATKVPAIYK